MDSSSPAPDRRALDVAIWRTLGLHALFIRGLLLVPGWADFFVQNTNNGHGRGGGGGAS